jgi:hypothetical protein
MSPEKHREKAERIEATIRTLNPEFEWELIVEGAYGAALNYIAYITEIKEGAHRDTHKGLPKFLEEKEFPELATLFRKLELHRQGVWYGGNGDGEASKTVLKILEDIKKVGGI